MLLDASLSDSSVDNSSNVHNRDQKSSIKNSTNLDSVNAKKRSVRFGNQSEEKLREGIQNIRSEFEDRYGGKVLAEGILQRGLIHPENRKIRLPVSDQTEISLDLARTAERMLQALEEERPFVMAFGGYSVTVGRGNHFHQSYPFVMERVIKPFMKDRLGLDLIVRNSAIGGTPSFPYGWCMDNLLGSDADVVSWEFGLNEGNSADGMESYLRHAMAMPRSPKFLLMDTLKRGNSPRLDVLKHYTQVGAMIDSLFVDYENSIKPLVQGNEVKSEYSTFPGLNAWDQWGGADKCPGKNSWHLKLQSHELIGWILSMHFIDALEIVIDVMNDESARAHIHTLSKEPIPSERFLPEPKSKYSQSGTLSDPVSLRFGKPSESLKKNETWKMNSITCRTTYDPILNGNVKDIVVSGVVEHEDILYKRDENIISKGWAVDVGKLERDTKIKVEKCGGLGYIDMKKSLYGLASSGPLKLQLPIYNNGQIVVSSKNLSVKNFETLVVCEVNEKRQGKPCQIENDVSFRVGGVPVTVVEKLSFTGVKYLGQEICYSLNIPDTAKLSKNSEGYDSLEIEAIVNNKSIDLSGACSISHVIWENV